MENLYLNILFGKNEYGLHSSHRSSRCVTKKPPLYVHVRHIFPKSKESPSVGSCSDRNKSSVAGIGMNREVSRVIGSSPWFGCSDQTCKNCRNNWRSWGDSCAGEDWGRLIKTQVKLMNGAGKRKHGSVQEIIMDPITRRVSVMEVRIRLLSFFIYW